MADIGTVVLVGPHGAGKTTLGRALGAALGWRFDEEIGERLRRQALTLDAGAHAQNPQEWFDEEVMRKEIARDNLAEQSGRPRIVETWHPGNLAYAQARSPEVAMRMRPVLEEAVARVVSKVLVQPVMLSEDALLRRRSEPGPETIVRWFLDVGTAAIEIARRWELRVAPSLRTDQLSPDQCLSEILASVRGTGGRTH